MAKVGDSVEVTIRGGVDHDRWGVGPANSTTDVGGVVTIGVGQTMTIPGKIVEDLGDRWVIELSINFSGMNRITAPKTAQR
ncbi:MAG: hypothetical protein EXR50_07930 [Dehalococcoidia bacterium]|nr:hypothetical protein [Dehalococcoidia bacterium]